jgi:hypothetical protein
MKKYIISGLIGFGISVGCLLPPILHFVTGPLGPFIGGFFGGMKARVNGNGAVAIGVIMGTCLSLFLVMIGIVIMSFNVSLPDVMDKIISSDSLSAGSLLKIAFIPFAIGATLGTLGAFVGGRVANKV